MTGQMASPVAAGVPIDLQLGVLDGPLTALVILGSAAGMLMGARLGQMVSPMAMGRVTASITVSVAVMLIVVNVAKVLGVYL